MIVGVIADVHGNRWALEAVLADLRRRGVERVVNLGDCFYGPLDPAGTAALLRELDPASVLGNQDRILLDPASWSPTSKTFGFVMTELGADDLAWLSSARPTRIVAEELFLCHGSPRSDEAYLLEEVSDAGGVALRDPAAVAAELEGVVPAVVLCGHTHVPRTVLLPGGRLVVNPGSVGLPAYTDAKPRPHAMETGSPHARCAVLEKRDGAWRVEQIAVPYPWDEAAACARERGREDWAGWLLSGRGGT